MSGWDAVPRRVPRRALHAQDPVGPGPGCRAPTEDEKGLQGSTCFVAHLPAPLETTAAAINIETLSPDGANRGIASWGNGRVSLEQASAEARQ